MSFHPRFTIVTISFNAEKCIERTIVSVIQQSYNNVEYIIVDGGSRDGTMRIVEKYKENINHYISEPDKGIYDAMNKGIKLATGDYLIFMNADDVFADNNVLQKVADQLKSDSDIVYGNWRTITEYGTFDNKPAPLSTLDKKFGLSHQAIFAKVSLLKQEPFDLQYKYAGDYNMISSYYLSGKKFQYVDVEIAEISINSGATFNHFEKSVKEHYQILAKRGLGSPLEMRWLITRKRVVRLLKTCLPKTISNRLFSMISKYYKVM